MKDFTLLLLTLGITLFLLTGLQAQPTITISGTVNSEDGREPLIGVNVIEKGAQNGAVTDWEGKYSITVPPDATLVFSYIGYETLEVPVENRTAIDVTMQESGEILDEVVVVGYRSEIKSNVASAISSIKAEDIEKLPVVGLDQTLQGQVSGLQVTQTTGAPGDGIAVRIRGAGTLGNNDPLYIIDGVPATGDINMFSTTDIESVEVLKDGAAAAIYGSRAANGVILITTKKGKAGAPQFNFNAYYGFQETYTLPDLLNAEEYVTIRNQAFKNANELRDLPRQLDTFDLAVLDTLPDINWLDEVFRPAPIQRYMLSASGGSENGTYYIAGEYLDQQGVFRGQGFEKYLLRFNGTVKSRRLKIGNNLSFSFTDRKVVNSSGDGAGPGNELSGIRYALIAAPVFPIRYDNGEYIKTTIELGEPSLFGDGNANPLAFIDATDWTVKRYRVFGNVFAELNLLEGLNLRTALGGDFLFRNEKLFKERLSQAIYDPSSLNEGRVIDQNLVWNNTLDFSRSLGVYDQHQLSLLVGMEAIQNRTDYLGASASNFILTSPAFRYINSNVAEEISDVGASGIVTEWGLLSYFAQLNYSFGGRYVLNTAVRRDGSSRFGEEFRYGTFPSLSLAWNISNEPFFAGVDFISDLKVRASWGVLGNQQVGVYPFSSRVETGRRVYPFGGQIATGAVLVETGNDKIKWETTTQRDLGLEFALFNGRVTFQADYYEKKSSDILVRIPIPQAGGSVNPPFVNAGEVENKGFDLALGYRQTIGDLRFSINGNISTVQNKVLSLADSEPILGGFGLSDGPITKTEPGYPIGSFFLYQMEGIFQSQEEIDASPFQSDFTRPGDVKFADLNDDGVIDDEDRAHLGNPFPDYFFGLNASFEYKNFDLSLLFQGVQGNDVYFLYGNFAYETQLRGFNSYRDILNSWTPDNPGAEIPIVSVDDRNGNRRISTRFLEDGSYVRLRNITLGYNFDKLVKRTNAIKGLRIYISAQNALTWTSYPGLDPEIQANTNDTQGFNVSSDLAVGIDWGTVPAPRTIIAGVNLDF